jgi:xylulokinase
VRFLIGVDIGTQGKKGALISESGQILASYSVEHEVSIPRPGWAEHDADRVWWDGFIEVVKALLHRSQVDPRDIAAVGISALMPVMLPLDVEGRPLRSAILYSDTRTIAEVAEMNERLAGEDSPALSAESVGPKILWFRAHEPDRWQQTASIMGAQGYVILRLTGRHVIDSVTATGMKPFLKLDGRGWDIENCNRFGVPVTILPEIVDMAEIVGTVTPGAAAATGLVAGTPVAGGASDFFAEMISTGADEVGDAVVSYGTTMCVYAYSSLPLRDSLGGPGLDVQDHRTLVKLFPHRHGMGGGMATSGAIARWYRDHFGLGELRAELDLGLDAYSLLGLGAEAVPPGAEGLVVLPYFSGERSPIYDDRARGVIFGLTLAHGRSHIYRAILEGVAYGLEHHFEVMREAGVPLRRVVATGGGSRSVLWTQIVSDVTGLPQTVVAPSNAALGAAFLAGYARGIFRQIGDVRQWVRTEREVRPRQDVHDLYRRYYAVYRRLYEQTKEEMHELACLGEESQPDPLSSPRTVRVS